MRAARLTAHGRSSMRVTADAPPPSIGPDDVLIRVAVVGVNQLDLNVIDGVGPGAGSQLPRILGIDPAGTVVAAGSNVPSSRIGTRVVVKPNISCGRCSYCEGGNEADCPNQVVIGAHRDGGAAELVAVPARNAFPIESLDFAVASAAVHSVPIALHALGALGGVDHRDTLLVTGASGAVGGAAGQLAEHFGARVISAVRREGHPPVAGAVCLAETPAELPSAVARLAPDGVSAVLDASGDANLLGAALETLSWGGRAVTCAASVDPELRIDVRRFYLRRNRLIGAASANYSEVAKALDLVGAGAVSVAIDSRFPLARIGAAYDRFVEGRRMGKVIVDVG
ncbi:alcohol dehydrogenase catalytic domain-containing protein [Lysobacter korlensis]|uniref:Alcohol dehydrogenase catalytic domain-containing protein n=1 Tax=Lysobacter korlensis TaxID=553636 RepID=A0ABV6S0W5_9GAMM